MKDFFSGYFSFVPIVVQSVVSRLQHQPIINAVIDGEYIIYRDDIDISIAVTNLIPVDSATY